MISTMREIWKAVPGYENFYDASTLGQIRGKRKNGTTKILQISYVGRDKRPSVALYGGMPGKRKYIHHIVLDTFKGPCPHPIGPGKDDWQANHKDGDRYNNRLSNLEYISHRANYDHAIRLNLTCKGERNARAKLLESDVLEIRKLIPIYGRKAVQLIYGVSATCIQYIDERRTWTHI